MADRVFIENLRLKGKHGVYDWEWENEQEFIIDISVDVDLKKAAKSDKIADTVDWVPMYEIARDTIAGPTIHLIEKIADAIAGKILEDRRIKSVTVTVRKAEILAGGIPGVTMTRTRP